MAFDNDDDERITPRSAEAWAMMCAIRVEQAQGARAPMHISEMIGKFAAEENKIGVQNWVAVAKAYNQLMRASSSLN